MRKLPGKRRKRLGALLPAFIFCIALSAPYCHATVPCATPDITSVSPSQWAVGKAIDVTIAGTGFYTVNGFACWEAAANVTEATGLVAFSSVNVASPSLIHAVVTVPSTVPSETACVEVAAFGAEVVRPRAGIQANTSNSTTCPSTGFPAEFPVQIVNCPTPTIASISPNLLYAGKSNSVTITGTGFTTLQAFLMSGCPTSKVTATAPDGSAVTVSGISVNSATSIVANVEPTSTAPTEGATITVSGAATPSANADILGAPVIKLNGQIINGPNAQAPNPEPVVGQALALTTTPDATALNALPIPLGIASSTWTVEGGTNIGGYSATTASGSVTPMPLLNTPSLNFYSVNPETSVAETFQLCTGPTAPPQNGSSGGNACNPVATASFSVNGGGTMASTPYNANVLTIVQLILCVNGLPPANGGVAVPFVAYGFALTGYSCQLNGGGDYGITFTPSGAPAGGTYSYAQLINIDDAYSTQGDNRTGCTNTVGVDLAYPYKGILPGTSPPQAVDAPYDDLTAGWVESRTFNASMFLLWTPPPAANGAATIPVPIGYQTWGFSGGAQQENGTWVANTDEDPAPGPIGGFAPSNNQTTSTNPQMQNGYPIWSGPSTCN